MLLPLPVGVEFLQHLSCVLLDGVNESPDTDQYT